MIVPFAAGGPNDGIARIMAERMRVLLGQPVMIENIDGAAGSIGTGRAARAAPDGYTISIGYWGTHVANAAIYVLDYDVVKDFEPISLLVESPLLIAASKATPASDLREFVNWLRANPDKASAAVPGSASHVASVFFQRETGTRFRLVPYRGAGPAIQDLAQGRIDMALLNAGAPLPHVRSGEFKAYAVSAKRRLAAAPDIPTVNEAGFPESRRECLVWFLGAGADTEGHHRQAQCRNRGDFGQSQRPGTAGRFGAGDFSTRAADPGGACRFAEGRDREVVADHQGCKYQAGVTPHRVTDLRTHPVGTACAGGTPNWRERTVGLNVTDRQMSRIARCR